MMQSVRKKLSIILMACIIASVVLSAIFVNIAMNNTFNKYMTDVQNQRNERIVQYFQQVYKKNGKWSKNSGEELMHEAYMSNYCLTLLDNNKNVIWGMNPKDIRDSGNSHNMMLGGAGKGVYTSKTFNINVDGKTVGYAEVGQYYAVLLTEQDINFKNSINKGIAVSALITIIIAAILSLTISKQFSRPIKRVSDTSVKLSNGDYESRTNIKSNIIEINNLIQSTNTLGEKLKVQDLLRKRLVSDLSHEIRTPLNVLQNNLEAMIDGVLPNTPERLNSLNDEVIRFGKLLNNLNSLKQFESKDAEIKFGTVFLDELLAGVCEDFRLIANERNIKIIFERQPKKYMILADEDKLRQVFINLISNAVKFNKENGCVWVNIEEIKDKYVVKIQDNGIGIKNEDLPYIFERLYRGDKSRQQVTGSGVGLTIVKQILNLHSASIEVTSEENTGTTFTVNFNKIA